MRSLRTSVPFVVALVAIAVSGATLVDPAGSAVAPGASFLAARPTARPQTASQSLFGFRVGEVRHYALGPPEALLDGESARWSIELHHLEDAGRGDGRGTEQGAGNDAEQRLEGDAGINAVFDLEYALNGLMGPLREPRLLRSVWSELTVNERGFPLKVVVGERTADGEIITEYVYRNGRYDKRIRWPETEWETDLTIPGHDEDDVTPDGVFLFMSRLPWETLTSWGQQTHAESVFANPGLLSLAIPHPVPADPWEREFVFLTPGEMLVRHPDPMWYRLQRSSRLRNAHFDRNKLELGDVADVEIGGQTVSARRFEIEGPFRDGYVDALGRVLLLEHDPGGGMEKPRHIRLLRPSEY